MIVMAVARYEFFKSEHAADSIKNGHKIRDLEDSRISKLVD